MTRSIVTPEGWTVAVSGGAGAVRLDVTSPAGTAVSVPLPPASAATLARSLAARSRRRRLPPVPWDPDAPAGQAGGTVHRGRAILVCGGRFAVHRMEERTEEEVRALGVVTPGPWNQCAACGWWARPEGYRP